MHNLLLKSGILNTFSRFLWTASFSSVSRKLRCGQYDNSLAITASLE
jgi:hypothetical protein